MDNSSSQDKFMFSQYSALRQEILDIKNRLIKMMGYGMVGVPLVIGSAEYWRLHEIAFFYPLIVVSVTLIVIFEQFSLMRAGAYINQYIETYFISKEATVIDRKQGKSRPLLGWEQWLEDKGNVPRTRMPEKCFIVSFYILSILYYLVSTMISCKTIQEFFSSTSSYPNAHIYAGCIYLAAFVFLIGFFILIHKGLGGHDPFNP